MKEKENNSDIEEEGHNSPREEPELVEVMETDVFQDSVNTVQKRSQVDSETCEFSIKSWKEVAGVALTPKDIVGTKVHTKVQGEHSENRKQSEDSPHGVAGVTLQSTNVKREPEREDKRRDCILISKISEYSQNSLDSDRCMPKCSEVVKPRETDKESQGEAEHSKNHEESLNLQVIQYVPHLQPHRRTMEGEHSDQEVRQTSECSERSQVPQPRFTTEGSDGPCGVQEVGHKCPQKVEVTCEGDSSECS